ncbi:MAG: hypothetical protein QM766_10490 [Burkholderiaceae bacterium]
MRNYTIASNTIDQIRAVRLTGRDGTGKWIEGPRFVGDILKTVADVSTFGVKFDESKVVPQRIEKPSF